MVIKKYTHYYAQACQQELVQLVRIKTQQIDPQKKLKLLNGRIRMISWTIMWPAHSSSRATRSG